MPAPSIAILLLVVLITRIEGSLGVYYGILIGDIDGFHGKVYAVNDKQVYITEMHLSPDAFARFCVGNDEAPSLKSTKIPDEYGNDGRLKEYADARVLLTLPSKITDYTYIGVCGRKCRSLMDRHCDWVFKKYGHVRIPDEFELPSEQNIGPLAGGENHANATEVILKDSATILLKKLNYDGQVPGAYFAVKPRPGAEQPEVTRLDDENSTNHTLKSYSNKDVTLLLPEGHHWNEYESFNLYSFDAGASFAHVNIRPEVAERLPVHRPTSYSPVVHGDYHWIVQLFLYVLFVPTLVCIGNLVVIYPLKPYPPESGEGFVQGAFQGQQQMNTGDKTFSVGQG